MRHNKMSRGCGVGSSGGYSSRDEDNRGIYVHEMKGVLMQKFMGKKVVVKVSIR
jgi:hypothetical protein